MALLEVHVLELFGLVLLADLMEVVHVQLAHERCALVVLEEEWEHICLELLDFLNLKTLSIVGPTNDILEFGSLKSVSSLPQGCYRSCAGIRGYRCQFCPFCLLSKLFWDCYSYFLFQFIK